MTSKNKTLIVVTRRKDLIEVAKRICKYFDVEILLPAHSRDCCASGFLVVDEEYIDMCKKHCKIETKPLIVLKPGVSRVVFAFNLLAKLVNDVDEVVIGIDPGSRLVYTIIAYSLLIDWGIASWSGISKLLLDLCNLSSTSRTKIIIGVGEGPGSNKLLEIISNVKNRAKCNLHAIIVNEYKTNYEDIIGIKGIEYIKGQRDFIAAVNISLRSLLGADHI